MPQLTINIDDKKLIPYLKKVLESINGVSIVKPATKRRSSLDIAMQEIRDGKVKSFDNVHDLFQDLGI